MAPFDFGEKVDPHQFDALIEGGYEFDMMAAVRRGWEMFRGHVGEFVGFTLIVFVVSMIGSWARGAGSLVVSAVAAPLYAGYMIAAFRILSGREITFSDFFRGFNYFLPLFLAGLASGVMVMAGFVLLIIPGIYLAVGYMLVTFLVVDYRMEFWQAMETSRKIVTRHWFTFFWFALLLFCINMLGALALFVGLLVSVPVTSCAAAAAYRSIVGVRAEDW